MRRVWRLLAEAASLTLSAGVAVGVISLFGEILLATAPDSWIDGPSGGSMLRDRLLPAFAAGFLAGASWGLLFAVARGVLREIWRNKTR
jgi:hypothetical protein